MVNPIDDMTPLERPLRLSPEAGHKNSLTTIADAAWLITKLDMAGRAESEHWMTASGALLAANDTPGDRLLLGHATDALAEALRREGMLQEAIPRAAPGRRALSWRSLLGSP